MRRWVVCLAALVLATACSSGSPGVSSGSGSVQTSPSPTPPPADTLKVGAVGAGTGSYVGAIITNESPTLVAEVVTLSATVKDASGKVVGTGLNYVTIVHPKEQLPVAIVVNPDGTPATVQVLAAVQHWSTGHPEPNGRITGNNVTITPDTYEADRYVISADLNSTYSTTFTGVDASAVCFDSSGNVIGAGSTRVPILPANGSTGVQIGSYGPRPSSCDVGGWPNTY